MPKTNELHPLAPLPPADPEGMNGDRAEWAMKAVRTFQRATGLKAVDGLDTAIKDLVCDLAHLCDRERLDLSILFDSAVNHYREETANETGPTGAQFEPLFLEPQRCRSFAEQIARMTTEQETEGGGTQEDHAAALNELIVQARGLTGLDPQYPKVYCSFCGESAADCDCDDNEGAE